MKKSIVTLVVVLFGLTSSFAQEKKASEKGKTTEATSNLDRKVENSQTNNEISNKKHKDEIDVVIIGTTDIIQPKKNKTGHITLMK